MFSISGSVLPNFSRSAVVPVFTSSVSCIISVGLLGLQHKSLSIVIRFGEYVTNLPSSLSLRVAAFVNYL